MTTHDGTEGSLWLGRSARWSTATAAARRHDCHECERRVMHDECVVSECPCIPSAKSREEKRKERRAEVLLKFNDSQTVRQTNDQTLTQTSLKRSDQCTSSGCTSTVNTVTVRTSAPAGKFLLQEKFNRKRKEYAYSDKCNCKCKANTQLACVFNSRSAYICMKCSERGMRCREKAIEERERDVPI